MFPFFSDKPTITHILTNSGNRKFLVKRPAALPEAAFAWEGSLALPLYSGDGHAIGGWDTHYEESLNDMGMGQNPGT